MDSLISDIRDNNRHRQAVKEAKANEPNALDSLKEAIKDWANRVGKSAKEAKDYIAYHLFGGKEKEEAELDKNVNAYLDEKERDMKNNPEFQQEATTPTAQNKNSLSKEQIEAYKAFAKQNESNYLKQQAMYGPKDQNQRG